MPKPTTAITVDVLKDGATDVKLYQLWGHYLAEKDDLNGLSSSQLRKFFGALKKIQADFDKLKGEIVLLDPKLAYAVGRDTGKTKTKIKVFYEEILRDLIRNIDEDKKRFKNFVDVFESIVAYHRERETELGKNKDND